MPEFSLVSGDPPPNSFGVPGTPVVVDQSHAAMRVVLRPDEHAIDGQVRGHYRMGIATGLTTTLGAGSILFSCRYVDPGGSMMLLKRLEVAAAISTAFTAGQVVDVDMIELRSFAASDTGGTQISPVAGAQSQKARSNMMGASNLLVQGGLAVATAAALATGSATTDIVDAQPIAVVPALNGNALGASSPFQALFDIAQGEHPRVYGNNEGFRVRVVTAQGAAGVVKYFFRMSWLEVGAY